MHVYKPIVDNASPISFCPSAGDPWTEKQYIGKESEGEEEKEKNMAW